MDEQTFEKIIGASLNIFNLPSEDEVMCENCKDIVPKDYGKQTEHDGFICTQCQINGYFE